MSHLFESFPNVYAGGLTQFLRGDHYFWTQLLADLRTPKQDFSIQTAA
jgi:hypothetical protein